MWVTAFDEVAEAILGITVSVKKVQRFRRRWKEESCRGSERMKCYMTIEKTQGVYTNYTVESMEPAGYFY